MIVWVLGILGTVLAGVILWKLRSQSEKNEKFSAAIIALEKTAVSEEHVRKIVTEALSPLLATMEKVVSSTHKIELYISEQRGFQAGQNAAQRRTLSDRPSE